jgi:drug/metabolite transporter (DMT)-like permease
MRSVDPLEASCIRLVTAALLGLLAGILLRRLGGWRRSVFAVGVAPRLAAAAVCGTYLGIWLSLTAFKYAPLAVATTLTALSPVFVLPLARIFLGLQISARAVVGALIALAGVAMFFAPARVL